MAPKLTLAAYTRFGARGMKGTETYYLVREAWKRGHLGKVIAVSKRNCQREFDLDLVQTLPGQSRLISGLGQIKKKLWRAFPSTWLGEAIFDRYAASKLVGATPNGVVILTPRMIRTAQRAKALGYRTFLYADHCDPRYLSEQIKLEQDTFGLKAVGENRNRSWQMARFKEHVDSSHHMIALSEYAKDTYVHYGFPRERIFVVPLGIDLQKFYATPPPSDFVFLLMAHVTGTTGILKGLQYLLQAWSELNIKNARLRVCGELGPEAQELIKRYRGKLKNAEFPGTVSNPEDHYRQSSVFVLPSLAEGLPKVVLEAMACGRPVITTPILKPVVREGIEGFYVPMRDVEALKERMLYFYNHRAEVARMGAHASERARNFTWERFSSQIADIVERSPGIEA